MRAALSFFFKLVLLGVAYVLLVAAWYAVVPDVKRLARENPGKTAFMREREAEWAAAGRKVTLQQRWVPLGNISPYLIKAVLISEDDKFWSHEGFDFEAMQKAMEKNLEQGRVRAGGSTISQQLAKNLWLSPSKNPLRKIKEAVLAWRLEKDLSKRRILEIYLNVAEWGDGIFGAEAAAHKYFGVPARDLSADQAVRLAVVLPNPIRFNPAEDSVYVRRRAEIIHARMVRRGIIQRGQGGEARPEEAHGERKEAVDPVAEALEWVKQNVGESEKGQ